LVSISDTNQRPNADGYENWLPSYYLPELLTTGFIMGTSDFKTVHRHPERVLQEAITNAMIHRY